MSGIISYEGTFKSKLFIFLVYLLFYFTQKSNKGFIPKQESSYDFCIELKLKGTNILIKNFKLFYHQPFRLRPVYIDAG